MRFRTIFFVAAAALAGALSFTQAAQAQASRTWISGVGDDANPCSRTAPCKTFAGAISKTAAGGEIDCLDPGGFGALTITKAITLDCGSGETGSIGSVLVAGTNGIVVSAGASDVVQLRKLTINGISGSGNGGINGIRFLAGKSLTVDNVNIMNFTTHGVDMATTTNSSLYVVNSNIMNCAGNGINIAAGGSGLLNVTVKGSRMYDGGAGFRAADNASATIHAIIDDSIATGNSNGFLATTSGGRLTALINRSVASNNSGIGIQADGSNTEVHLGYSSAYGNGTGLSITNSALMVTNKNNNIDLNGSNISGTLTQGGLQ